MDTPYFLLPELARRLGRDVTAEDRANGLAILGLDENEPDLSPNVRGLTERFGKQYEIGSFVLPAELTFLDQKVPFHFKISYAGLISPQFATESGPETAIRIEMLTWTEGDAPRPRWSPIGPCTLSDKMMEEILAGISWHAKESNLQPKR